MEVAAEAQKVQVLSHQNTRLATKLEEARRESKILEEKVAAYESKESEYAQTLLCVNRLWDQLQRDVRHLCVEALGDAENDSDKNHAGTKKGLSGSDPFLARLLTGDVPAPVAKSVAEGQKEVHASLSDVEKQLSKRCTATKAELGRVLDAVRNAGGARMGTAAGHAEQHAEEPAALLRQLDHSHAVARTARERMQLSEDRQLEAEERIKQMQNELADAEETIATMQRKVAALKAGGQADGCQTGLRHDSASTPSGTPNTAAAAAASHAPGSLKEDHNGMQAALDKDLAEDVKQLQALLENRNTELEKEKEAHVRTERELHEMTRRLGDESWVAGTRTHQHVVGEVQRLMDQLDAKTKDMEAVARERDEAMREASTRNHFMHLESASRVKVSSLEKALREAQVARMESERACQELKLQLHHEQHKAGEKKTVAELNVMITTLQAQVANQQQHLKLNTATAERLAAGAAEVAEARERMQAAEAAAQRLSDRLRRKELDLEEQRRREAALKDRANELRAFVDVLTVVAADEREAAELRASERALREQLETVKADLQGHSLQARVVELEAAEKAGREQLDILAVEADALRAQIAKGSAEASELSSELATARQECQLYIAEMDSLCTGFEEMQSQNARLLTKLAERDEAHSQLLAERVKLLQVQAQLQEAEKARSAEAQRIVRDHADACAGRELLEKDVARLAQELTTAREQARMAASRAEAALVDVKRSEEAATAATAQMEGLQKGLAESRAQVEEAHEKLVKEKTKKRKMEDEKAVERLRKITNSGSAARELQEEIDAMRRLLNCNVCHERQKNVIITKCCHVFCDKCIKKNLENRNRKCPGCGIMYGQADVKPFWLT